ncbi:MAG: hypothetical protein K9G76_08840 [Bacteroidales bacterium]|nr:hypothetical protein [Bacteroidales bacterium]MCF8404472.1 hypothetical protein [Bacteroidales bacterium]
MIKFITNKFWFNFIFLLSAVVSYNLSSGQDTGILDYVVVRDITFKGNKITRERIIQRELLFKKSDTIPTPDLEEKLQQSQKNLMNTSLFNFVTVEATPVEGMQNQVDINIDFLERWYIWPVPLLEFADRNFNEWLKKKDWTRLNYGMFLTWNNFRGRREKLVVFTRLGYDQKYQLGYQIPYVNRKQTIGLGFAGGFSQNHEIPYNSYDNKEVYYKDENQQVRREVYAYSELYYRKGIHNKHWLKLIYNDLEVDDSITIKNSNYMFGTGNRNQYLTFYYQFRSDFRDYTQYPLKGYYFDVELDKKGLGAISSSKVNSMFVKANYRKYFHLKGKFFWASGFTAKVSPFWQQPYYYIRGLGYGREFVRGYEYYVIDAQHYGVLKNNLKFELVSQRVQEFKFIPSDKFNKLYYAFYLNVFADFGYGFDNRNNVYNPLSNQLLPGYGIGLDFVTYYDFVFRLEYSFNKMGESGFFIHFMPSI